LIPVQVVMATWADAGHLNWWVRGVQGMAGAGTWRWVRASHLRAVDGSKT
jgi:hypothetical protein